MEKNEEHFLNDFKVYENIDIGNCRINPDALDKINFYPKYAIVIIDEEYDDLIEMRKKMEKEIHEAMRVPAHLLGNYPEGLDFCIIIEKEE